MAVFLVGIGMPQAGHFIVAGAFAAAFFATGLGDGLWAKALALNTATVSRDAEIPNVNFKRQPFSLSAGRQLGELLSLCRDCFDKATVLGNVRSIAFA